MVVWLLSDMYSNVIIVNEIDLSYVEYMVVVFPHPCRLIMYLQLIKYID